MDSTYYSIVASVIAQGDYNLDELIPKIDAFWLKGQLTDEQHTELVQQAQDNADPMVGLELAKMVNQLGQQITALESRVTALESARTSQTVGSTESGNDGGEGGESTQDPADPVPPEWQTGMIVYAGARVTYNGHVYECIAPENMPCTWNPDRKPDYWKLIS